MSKWIRIEVQERKKDRHEITINSVDLLTKRQVQVHNALNHIEMVNIHMNNTSKMGKMKGSKQKQKNQNQQNQQSRVYKTMNRKHMERVSLNLPFSLNYTT